MPADEEMPSTIRRSEPKARRTWGKTHDNAVEEYGEGERAHRTAYAALKHSFEKRGDNWARKEEPGPSDPRSTHSTEEKRRGESRTFGGVDYYGQSKAELYARARELDVPGRSKMGKAELAEAIARRQG